MPSDRRVGNRPRRRCPAGHRPGGTVIDLDGKPRSAASRDFPAAAAGVRVAALEVLSSI
ncbi:hypothetical protein [Amycolatopsis circi]|uniref:hypothetical protein n=1 Tax=Amycolatopsis circi TaxID=871959 RepID=UPI0013BEA3FD|nr:hypothetical protein [Amycolatopsis circi]